jgi:hypothetical protein
MPADDLRLPHAAGDALLLGTYGIGVDGRRGKLRVPQPLLNHIERNTGRDSSHAEAVAQSFRSGLRSFA